MLEKANKLAKLNLKTVGQTWITTRATLTTDQQIDEIRINFNPYKNAAQDCIRLLNGCKAANDASCEGQLLYSSMFCETTFSSYTAIKTK